MPYALLDSDKTGKEFQTSLKQGLYSNEKTKVLETDTYTNKQGSEIEDLIPANLIEDSFDRLFRPDDNITIDNQQPIVPQLEAFAQEQRIVLELGWKVEISKRVKQKFSGDVPDELLVEWTKLFNNLQRKK